MKALAATALAALAFTAAFHHDTPNVHIVGNDYAFIHPPDTLAAGQTTFSFENQGKVRHEMSIFLVSEGATLKQLMDVFTNGGPRKGITDKAMGLLVAQPGDTSGGRLLLTLVPDRTYAIVCTLHDKPDAPAHAALGMISTFRVRRPSMTVASAGPVGVTGLNAREYRVRSYGTPLDSSGATQTLTSSTAVLPMWGASYSVVDAAPFRGTRVKLSATLETRDVPGGASLWVRADTPGEQSVLDNGMTRQLGGTATEGRESSILVPVGANILVIGIILNGPGSVTAQHLRLEVVKQPTP